MCGIAGVVFPDRRDPPRDAVERAARALGHRGPDGQGMHVSAGVALAHRRLAILDLTPAAAQPMPNEDHTVWVTFNGEIYNHHALQEELEAKGHRFRSRSDTEVLVHLYEEVGDDLVTRISGMFSFAIWDERSQHLLAARDRLGKKPFAYHVAPDGTFWFGSEPKALLAAGVESELDDEAIAAFLTLQYVPAPRSALARIQRLPAAHRLTLDRGGSPRVERYWRLVYGPKSATSFEDAERELEHRLAVATAARLESDVPLGAFLSGGIDSSLVVAMMARASSTPVRTFSVGFGNDERSELPFARDVAKRFGTVHEEITIWPPAADAVERMVAVYDDPFADVSALPTLWLSEATRRHVTVALTGDGGDESFAGYFHHRALVLLAPPMRLPGVVRGALARLLPRDLLSVARSGSVSRRLRRALDLLAQPSLEDAYRELVQYVPGDLRYDLLQPHASKLVGEDVALSRERAFGDVSRGGLLDRLLSSDVESYLPDCLMTKTDMASMASSLECRSPFLDHELMEFVARLPSRWKTDGVRSKVLLRSIAHRVLPASVTRRGKQGFSMPVEEWLRGDLRELLLDVLDVSHPLVERYVRPAAMRKLIDEHLRRERTWKSLLWTLLVLELWLRRSRAAYQLAA